LAAGQVEPGMDLYRQAANLMADNVSVRRKLVRQTLDLDEALMRGEEIRAIEGDTGLHWKFEQAGALLRLDPYAGSLSRARDLLEQCLADRPRWPSARLLLGYAHELSGELQDAVDAYRTAIAQEPDLRAKPVAIRLVGLLNRLGRLAAADALLNSLVTVSPNEPTILRLRTEQQIRERDFDSALATAERLLELQPDDPAWTVATAELHLRVGDPARAETIAQAALTHLPHSTPILWSLARALVAQHRSAEAEELVRKAVTEANDAPHYLLLAYVLARLDQQSEAEQAIAQAQRLAPQDAAVWAACADFWGSVNQRARQVICTRKAIELRGEDPAESLALARLLASSDSPVELAEADAITRRRLEADPDDVPTLIVEAKLAVSAEPSDLVKAEASLRRALANDPRSPDAHRLLTSVRIRSGEFVEAAEAVAVSLAFVPDDPDLLLSAGELHCFHGKYRKAIAPLRRLLEVRPRTPRGVRLLATAYQETGQVNRAIEFVEGLAPQDALTASETLILARLHEVNNDLDRAEVLFLLASRLDEGSSGTFQEVLKFYARRQGFRRVHTLGSQRRADFPNDVTSLAVAGEILGAQCPDATLRETGMEWLEEIAREHPDWASDALFRTGMCYYQQGDLEKAEDKFLRASSLAPEASGPVVNALAWMYAEDLGRPDDARAVIDRFLAAGGHEDARLMDTHATVLLCLGELEAARQKLAECLKRAGQTSTLAAAHYHLGLVLFKGGDVSEAVSYIKTAMRLADRLGGLTEKEREQAERLIADRRSAHDAPRP
jgi:tetratricopeptide (TPR) repeat protein